LDAVFADNWSILLPPISPASAGRGITAKAPPPMIAERAWSRWRRSPPPSRWGGSSASSKDLVLFRDHQRRV